MNTIQIVYWREDDAWIGYLKNWPDYWTQGNSIADLLEHLMDLLSDVTSGRLEEP
jgi:predicted RNase H-like HicB family nuclease